ncbi:hypothetical protein GCM10009741_05850 [Kribbella lupini]|uniref:Uncharacterized protein n=1 Tax=Kribbella lupini TaxID=291602 RepID=A0ABN2A5A3_9ACTN
MLTLVSEVCRGLATRGEVVLVQNVTPVRWAARAGRGSLAWTVPMPEVDPLAWAVVGAVRGGTGIGR